MIGKTFSKEPKKKNLYKIIDKAMDWEDYISDNERIELSFIEAKRLAKYRIYQEFENKMK